MNYRTEASSHFQNVQNQICSAFEEIDGKATFITDVWDRVDTEELVHGGGGVSKIIRNGKIFEQGGVNFSEVSGILPAEMSHKLIGIHEKRPFYATGLSIVIHPQSPLIPTIHANYRYIEVDEFSWFGGGTDLTPYYIYEEDCKFFHSGLKSICDKYSPEFYSDFKKNCDEYFYLPHRKECRGIGGIFFDYIGKNNQKILSSTFDLVKDFSEGFLGSYLPIIEKREKLAWTESQKKFQLIRRGRYVEFNLLYDRGTLFGLKTGGRIESILMSLPPVVNWEYDFKTNPGSSEEQLLNILKNPIKWV